MEKKRMVIYVAGEDYKSIKVTAAELGISMGDYLVGLHNGVEIGSPFTHEELVRGALNIKDDAPKKQPESSGPEFRGGYSKDRQLGKKA